MEEHTPQTAPTILARALAYALVAGLAFTGCGDDTGRDEESAAAPAALPAAADAERDAELATLRPSAEPSSILDAPVSVDEPREPAVDGLDVRRVAVARGVEDREPVEAATSFASEEAKLYAHFELTNREGTVDRHPMVVFVGPDGEDRGLIELEVPAGAPRWRTWAYSRNVRAPGEWRVELRDEEGRVLTDHEFTIEPSRAE